MSSSGNNDSKRKKSCGSTASSEDEQEAEKDRMETKRHREKKRRFEITHAVERLSKTIMKIDPEILQSRYATNINARSNAVLGQRLGVNYGNHCSSLSFHRSLNRTDVITCACEVMEHLHHENERLKQELKQLSKDRELGQGLFQSNPVCRMDPAEVSSTAAAATTTTTNDSNNPKTNKEGFHNLHNPNVASGSVTSSTRRNSDPKLHSASLLTTSTGVSSPPNSDSMLSSQNHQQQHSKSSTNSIHPNSVQSSTETTLSSQMLQNHYNLLQHFIQMQQIQQQYPLAMHQLSNPTGIGVQGLFPTNSLFGVGASSANSFSGMNPLSLTGGINSLPLGTALTNSYDLQSLQQLLLSSRYLQHGSNQEQGVTTAVSNAPGKLLSNNHGTNSNGYECKGNGRINGGDGDSSS
jgi:hypothetical protein